MTKPPKMPLEPLRNSNQNGPRWKSPRDVSAPEGYDLMSLGDPFEAFVGPFFENRQNHTADVERGEPLLFAFQIDDRHVNARQVCHGGMFMTFADAMLGHIAWRTAKTHTVTLSMQSQFLKPGHLGDWVIIRPKLVRKTRSIIFVDGTFEINDEIVYTATSLWKVIGR
jgi:acyl-coenzyme A thioesterase PaaI-like protein